MAKGRCDMDKEQRDRVIAAFSQCAAPRLKEPEPGKPWGWPLPWWVTLWFFPTSWRAKRSFFKDRRAGKIG